MSLHRYLSLLEQAGGAALWLDVQRAGSDAIDKLRKAEAESTEKFADELDDRIRAGET